MFPEVMSSLKVPRRGGGRPRTTPTRTSTKAYSSKANRQLRRDRSIQTVIPERSDQTANRKRLGTKGGRPPGLDILRAITISLTALGDTP